MDLNKQVSRRKSKQSERVKSKNPRSFRSHNGRSFKLLQDCFLSVGLHPGGRSQPQFEYAGGRVLLQESWVLVQALPPAPCAALSCSQGKLQLSGPMMPGLSDTWASSGSLMPGLCF